MKKLFSLSFSFLLSITLFAQEYEDHFYGYGGPLVTNQGKSFVINKADSEIKDFPKKVVWANIANAQGTSNGFLLFSLDQSGVLVKSVEIPTNHMFGISAIARAKKIIQTADGGYVVLGSFVGNTGLPKTLVAKFDFNLNFIWSREIYKGFTLMTSFNDIIEHSSGKIILVGVENQPFSGGIARNDVVVLQLSSTGNTLSQHSYSIKDLSAGYSIVEHSSSDLMIVGTTQFVNETPQILAMRVRVVGPVFWAKTLSPSYDYIGRGLDIIKSPSLNDEFYITGSFERINTSGEYFIAKENVFLSKIDDFGNILWSKRYGGDEDERCVDIRVEIKDSDINLSLTGHTYSFGNGQSDILFMKTKENGELIYAHTYGGAKNDFGYESKSDDLHESIIGTRSIEIGTNTFQPNISMAGFQLNGDPLSCFTDQALMSVSVSLEDELLITETLNTISVYNNSYQSANNRPITHIKECGSFFATRIANPDLNLPATESLSVSPNPVAGDFIFAEYELENELVAPLQLRLNNILGKLVHAPMTSLPTEAGKHIVKVSTKDLPSGVYILELASGNQFKATQKFIIQK